MTTLYSAANAIRGTENWKVKFNMNISHIGNIRWFGEIINIYIKGANIDIRIILTFQMITSLEMLLRF